MVDTYDDFARKYDRCYLLVRLKNSKGAWGDLQIVYLTLVDAQSSKQYKLHMRVGSYQEKIVVMRNDQVQIIPKLPSGGYLNYNNNCYFISRTPYRQWKRAVNNKTINTFSLTDIILKKYVKLLSETNIEVDGLTKRKPFLGRSLYKTQEFSIPYVSSMYWKKFPTYAQAFRDLSVLKTCGSVALSEFFAISYSSIHDKMSMYSYVNPIAEIDSENIHKVCVTEPLYFQEIQDYFNRRGTHVQLSTK